VLLKKENCRNISQLASIKFKIAAEKANAVRFFIENRRINCKTSMKSKSYKPTPYRTNPFAAYV
jgi:hypothetical protein